MVKSTEAVGAPRTKSGAANGSAVEEGGQAKLGGVLGEGEEVLGAAPLQQGAGPAQRRQCLCIPRRTLGPPGPKAALHRKAKGPARELVASGSVDRGSHLTASTGTALWVDSRKTPSRQEELRSVFAHDQILKPSESGKFHHGKMKALGWMRK